MATNLYDVLGLSRNATAEEIRKAYRRKALETHPDRLPQGASTAEKSAHEEMFRKINNAYEVLHDPESRATYDRCGIWPPPAPTAQGPSANGPHQSFSDPFFRDPFPSDPFSRGPRTDPFAGGFAFGPRPGGPRGFTDPFILFNSIFGDLQRAFESEPFFDDHSFGRRGFGSNHFGGGFFNNHAFPSILPSPFDLGGGGMGSSRTQTFSSGGNGGRWVSQSWSSSTVNGVTHTKAVRRDSAGNEHVLYQYGDGTERRTVNGVEQSTSPPLRALPAPTPHASHPTRSDSMPPPPSYYDAVAQPPARSRSSRHHGYHPDQSGHRHEDRDRHGHKHSRDRGREYEAAHDGHGYHDDGYEPGHDANNSSPWNLWRS